MRRSDKIKDRVLVKSYFNAPEKASTEQQAAELGLSLSEFVRRVATTTPLPRIGNAKAIQDLLQVNADLARLGNLLKMMLDDEVMELEMVEGQKTIEDLIQEIRQTQTVLKEAALSLG